MPSKLKNISGKKVLKFFESHNFLFVNQHGGHMKIRRIFSGIKQNLVIPNHSVIKKGTLREIFNQASKYISEKELRNFFYTE